MSLEGSVNAASSTEFLIKRQGFEECRIAPCRGLGLDQTGNNEMTEIQGIKGLKHIKGSVC